MPARLTKKENRRLERRFLLSIDDTWICSLLLADAVIPILGLGGKPGGMVCGLGVMDRAALYGWPHRVGSFPLELIDRAMTHRVDNHSTLTLCRAEQPVT